MDNSSLVLRPLQKSDLNLLINIAKTVGPGFTSLPDDKNFLEQKLQRVVDSFEGNIDIAERLYLFVLEDIENNKPAGVCGIEASVGCSSPFYNFKISTITQLSKTEDKFLEHKILQLVNNFQHAAELVTLYLFPEYRGNRRSELLSRARLLFIAEFNKLFSDTVIAEIRGVSDEKGYAPFWEYVCRPFFDMEFTKADMLTNVSGKQFIADLMPTHPIYLELLPKEVHDVIGVANKSANKAKQMLMKEGFQYRNYIDIFDGGPLIEAKTDFISSIVESKKVEATIVDKFSATKLSPKLALICNTSMDYRLCLAEVNITSAQGVEINKSTASKLKVSANDKIRYCLF